jgi:uncharacterized membrane protein required for colicin V production
MIDKLLILDWLFIAIALIFSITGAFRGLSGTIAFVAAFSVSLASYYYFWPLSSEYFDSVPVRILVVMAVLLIVFGIVRLILKKTINVLISQPSDSIFGFLTGFALAFAILFVWVRSNLYLEFSYIATQLAQYLN